MADGRIEDGKGSKRYAGVDANQRLHVRAYTTTEETQAVIDGRAFNINTGNITITGNTAALYFKNDEEADYIITAIANGYGAGTTTDLTDVYFVNNPTTGDMITAGVSVDMKLNRNAGSPRTLKDTTLVYKGASGESFDDGSDAALFYQGASGRLFASFPFVVPAGKAVGIRVDPTMSGNMKTYVALVGYIADVKGGEYKI